MKTLRIQHIDKKEVRMIEENECLEIHINGKIVGIPVAELKTANCMFSAVVHTLQMLFE